MTLRPAGLSALLRPPSARIPSSNSRKAPPVPTDRPNHIIVAGHGDFPRDMLRYDGLAPATPEDARSVDLDTSDLRAHESRRVVRLVPTVDARYRVDPLPTRARWESFGWTVVSHDHYGIRRPPGEIESLCALLGRL
jgi:hypothetical protein